LPVVLSLASMAVLAKDAAVVSLVVSAVISGKALLFRFANFFSSAGKFCLSFKAIIFYCFTVDFFNNKYAPLPAAISKPVNSKILRPLKKVNQKPTGLFFSLLLTILSQMRGCTGAE
jgi:hypothetical protein